MSRSDSYKCTEAFVHCSFLFLLLLFLASAGAGRFPPMMHRQMAPEGRGQRGAGSGFSRAHNSEAIARVKGSGSGTGTGAGTGGKSNLAGQIIPVYGFGILLYILYILFKITSKGSSKPAEGRTPSTRTENMKRKITDYELAQLQEKLRETELVMENIVSNAHHSPDRLKGVTLDQEESLLLQLTEITRVMQEGQLVDAVAPQKKKGHDQWEGTHLTPPLLYIQAGSGAVQNADWWNPLSAFHTSIHPPCLIQWCLRTGLFHSHQIHLVCVWIN
uniref:Resistance to inhibitors of cholinesterase protein 3 N-terminal domain-containing protein n=1 Tax=Sphaeramia orbicularis TaxID=375764 RepID=A0A673AEG8_9TELE